MKQIGTDLYFSKLVQTTGLKFKLINNSLSLNMSLLDET